LWNIAGRENADGDRNAQWLSAFRALVRAHLDDHLFVVLWQTKNGLAVDGLSSSDLHVHYFGYWIALTQDLDDTFAAMGRLLLTGKPSIIKAEGMGADVV
jgi:hypothetical protein